MRSGGGKAKGAAFERKICVALSKWVSRGKREDLFWRSAMSGGRATLAARKGVKLISQGGDVSAIDPLGAPLTDSFYIEIKFYNDLDLAAFWLGYGKLYKFWETAKREARRYRKGAMLIAKQNRYDTLVLLQCDDNHLLLYPALIRWRSYKYNAALIRFDDLLKKYEPRFSAVR